MPQDRRVDFIAIIDSIGLPVEIKGQWDKEVWDASKKRNLTKNTRATGEWAVGVYQDPEQYKSTRRWNFVRERLAIQKLPLLQC